jgi:hypothetical protein
VSLRPLEKWLSDCLTGETRAWYEFALAVARRVGVAGDEFLIAWSGCGRRLGRSTLAIAPAEADALLAGGAPFVPQGWGTDEAGRGLLLLAAVDGSRRPDQIADAVAELFAKGEMREQQALLRVLAHLPEPDLYASLAADAVRTNVLPVLEALALDNPFPARHMPDPAFNQMIMKVIFNDLPLRRVQALPERNRAELRRMVSAYASERRAAGRPVPADVNLILGGSPNASV